MECILSHYTHTAQNNGEYVIVLGKDVAILRTNGELIAHRKDLKSPYKAAFLAENAVLVECPKLREYVILSLQDGSDLLHIKMPKIDNSRPQFLVSPDQKHVYDLGILDCEFILIHIDLVNQEASIVELEMGLRSTVDIKFDQQGVLCLLQEHTEMIGGKTVTLCGVRYEYFDSALGIGSSYYWQSKWQFDAPERALMFGSDTHSIITSKWNLYDARHNTSRPWVNAEQITDARNYSYAYHCSADGKYIVLSGEKQTLVIDLEKEELVARYYTGTATGCIIGDFFWLPTDNGIVKKPFPVIEKATV